MANEAVISQEEWKPKHNSWILACPTIIAAFMFVLDETIANVALPHIAGTFSVSRDESTWVLTSYLVASGIAIPAVNWFCKLFGRKNYFMICILIFISASVMCGISNSIEMIIFARILQGFGGGPLLPMSQAIMLEAFPVEKRGQSMAAFGLVVVFAPIIGPVLGGWITDNWNWPWVFFINLPIGLLGLFMANKFLEDPPYARKQRGVSIDGIGFSFLVLWLVTFQIIMDKGNNADWFHSAWICRLALISLICAIAFFVSQVKIKNPLVDLSVLKDRNFVLGTFVQMIIQAVLLASLAILPMFLQSLLGYDAFLSGLAIMPRGAGALVSVVICGVLSAKVDNRLLAAIGLMISGIGGLWLGSLNLNISSSSIAFPNFVFGFGMGFAMIPLVALSVITLKNSQMTNASGLQNLLKNVSGAIGTSVAATLITRFSQIHQTALVKHLNPLNPVFQAKLAAVKGALMQYTSANVADYMAQYSMYGELLKQSTLWGFIETFRIFGVASFIIIPLVFLMKNNAKIKRTEPSKHQ